MANEILGIGTTLSGAGLGAVTGLRDVTAPNEECDDVDISSNDDAAGRHSRRFKAGMLDPGELSFSIVGKKTTIDAIQNKLRVDDTFTVTMIDGSTFTFAGYIKSISPELPWEGESTVDVVAKVSGDVTFTPV